MDMQAKFFKIFLKILFIFALSGIFYPVTIRVADAATLLFSPSSGKYEVGDNFVLNVLLSSADQSVNAASAEITYPSDKLEINSFSKTGSIFTLWVQEPAFSNAQGSASLEGIVLNPGFQGASGKIISFNFRVKAGGNASISFRSGAVLANDGNGTNILTGMGASNLILGTVETTGNELMPNTNAQVSPAAPIISSVTHPNQELWYTNPDATFSWSIPPGVTELKFGLNADLRSAPSSATTQLVKIKEFKSLSDGVWYFHLQFRNQYGWGQVAHYKVQIDKSTPNKFDIELFERKVNTASSVKVGFQVEDKVSGIDRVEVESENGEKQTWVHTPDSKIFEITQLSLGNNVLTAKAFDKAGNFLTKSFEIEVEPLQRPEITYYSDVLDPRDVFVVRGKTYPGLNVNLTLIDESKRSLKFYGISHDDGLFSIVADQKLENGVYLFTVDVSDSQGGTSLPTDPISILVKQPTLLRIGSIAFNWLVVFVPLFVLFVFVIGLGFYGWRKLLILRKGLKQGLYLTEKTIDDQLDQLKSRLSRQIQLLETAKSKRELTEEEDKIIVELKRGIAKIKATIDRDFDELEKTTERDSVEEDDDEEDEANT